MADLVGAVKAKCAKLGLKLRPPSPADRAKQIAAKEKLQSETEQLLRTTAQPLYDAAASLFAAIEQRLLEVEQSTGWTILRGHDVREFVAFMDLVSIQLQTNWLQNTAQAEIGFRDFSGRMPTPEERKRLQMYFGEMEELHSRRLKLVRVSEQGWCWVYNGRALSTEATADEILDEFISFRGKKPEVLSPLFHAPRRI